MKMKYVWLLCLFLAGKAYAQTTFKEYRSFKSDHNRLTIAAANGYLVIEPWSATCVRVSYVTNPAAIIKSYSTVGVSNHPQFSVKESKNSVNLRTASLEVQVNKADLAVKFVRSGNTITQASDYTFADTLKSLDFKLNKDEAIYGGGSKAIYINRRGKVLENYNQAHYGYQFGQTDLNISIPMLVSNRLYAIYFDNYGKGKFDIGKTRSNELKFSTGSGTMSFFLMSGDSFDQLLNQYTDITGKQPLPPRWAFGFFQSRYGYRSWKQVDNVVDSTRKAGIPLDAMVLDLYWYGDDKLMGNHSFDRERFRDATGNLKKLRDEGVKIIPISETFVTRKSENYKAARAQHLLTLGQADTPYVIKNFWAGPAALLDIFKPEAQQFYWNFYRSRIKEGVAGWWFDLGEPESHPDTMRHVNGPAKNVHNVYALVWAKTLYNGYRKEFPDQRVFNLIRSGYAGMQHYSVFSWSGDISRTWLGLKAQVPVILGMGFSGVGYTHFDAGGFTGAVRDPELYTRWLELASFVPVMRAHSAGLPSEPIYWDDKTRAIVTDYVKLRYSFLPYNYSLAYLNTTTGRPLVLPLNYFEPENNRLENINDEYLWGKDVLVAPVIVKGDSTKKVLFPKGQWIDWWTKQVYADSATVKAPLSRMPLFVRDGAFIPRAYPMLHTEEFKSNRIVVDYFPLTTDKTDEFNWYNDDGRDPDALKNGKYELINFRSSKKGKLQEISIRATHTNGKISKHIQLFVVGRNNVRHISCSVPYLMTTLNNEIVFTFDWDGKPFAMSFE